LGNMRHIRVVAALMRDETGQRILITRRMDHGEFGGYWEFPGGKVEPGETDEQALARELLEELGAVVRVGEEFYAQVFQYRTFVLDFHILHCLPARQELRAIGVAEIRWVLPGELFSYRFPPADTEVVARLAGEGVG